MKNKLIFTLLFALLSVSTVSAQETLKLDSLLNSYKGLKKESSSQKTAHPKAKIAEIKIVGNAEIPATLIENEINLKVGQIFNPYRVDRTVNNIESLGFFSKVSAEVVDTSKGKRIIFHLTENPKLSEIKLVGNTAMTDAFILEALDSRVGEILNLRNIRKDIGIIESLYEEKGFSQARVFGVESPQKPGDPLIFKIGEGVIERIIVTGNYKTKSYVILREVESKPGEPLHDETLKKDLRRIFNLNYFTSLEPHLKQGEEPNTYVLELDVTERGTSGSFSFGGGFSPGTGLSIFSDLSWDNLFGTGQSILLKGQFGIGGKNSARNTSYQFRYHNPWMWDKRKSFTFRTWLIDGEVPSVTPFNTNQLFRNERRRGLDMAIGIPHTYEIRSSHKLKYEGVTLFETNPTRDIPYTIASYTLGFSYDSRDIWFNPRSGHYHTFNIERSLLLRKDSLDFTRYDLTLRKFFPTFDRQTIATRLTLGYIQSPDSHNSDLFSGEWYYVGGAYTVRGYDDFDRSVFGNKTLIASTEYRFLFNDTFQLVFFVDAGYATLGSASEFKRASRYRIGKGLGIRLNVPPLGPLRLDFGMDNTGTVRGHFSIGHTF